MAIINQYLTSSSGNNTLYVTPKAIDILLNSSFICCVEAVFFAIILIIIVKRLKTKINE
jgi:hypothetical protein